MAILPFDVVEGQPVDPDFVNGTDSEFVVTMGTETASVRFISENAGNLNSLLTYQVGDDGIFENVQVAFEELDGPDRGGGPLVGGETKEVGTFGDGVEIGLALVQNGSPILADLPAGTFEFRSASGGLAATTDGAPPTLVHIATDGTETEIDVPIFHTVDGTFEDDLLNPLNPDGAEHTALTNLDDDLVTIVFEDLEFTDPDFDGDFNDAIVQIEFEQVDNGDKGTPPPTGPAIEISGSNLVVTPDGRVGVVDLSTGNFENLLDTPINWTDVDIAPDGTVFGISSSAVFTIDLDAEMVAFIGFHGVPAFDGLNSLEVSDNGQLLAASQSGSIFELDTDDGSATFLSQLPEGIGSAGDLQFIGNELYLTDNLGSDELVLINPNDGFTAQVVGQLNLPNGQEIFGITTDDNNTPIGLTDQGGIFSIALLNGDTLGLGEVDGGIPINGAAAVPDGFFNDAGDGEGLDSSALTENPAGLEFGPIELTGLDPSSTNTLDIDAVLQTDDGSMFDFEISTTIDGSEAPSSSSLAPSMATSAVVVEAEPALV
ncbi:MAG: hypothetical protein ACFB6S_17615 [Geminicoccaceae bacterium]